MRRFLAIALVLLADVPAHAQDDEEEDLDDMSLEDLMEVSITSASNREEKLSDAPAQVIVLTRDELEQRGYRNLGEVFDDLPGMDVVHPYGDNYVLTYWRGYRSDVAAPFLMLVDGIPINGLYYVDADVPLTALPLSSIERVEIVQGPASSVYGPNAFMGVINVITTSDADEDGLTQRGRLGAGTDGARIGDVTTFYKHGALRVRLSARFETGLLDDAHLDEYEFTQPSYTEDRRIWGGFVDNPNLGGRYLSRHTTRALEAHVFHGDSELGARWLELASGYGVEYAGDRVQPNAVWARQELDLYLRHARTLADGVTTRTTLRYRTSGVPNRSFFVDGYNDATAGRVAAFSYWQSRNRAWALYQDLELTRWTDWAITAGLKVERKDMQKAYDINGEGAAGTPGGYEPAGTITADGYAFPEPPPAVDQVGNRILTEDVGVYVQARYDMAADHHLYGGARVDRNSGYHVAPTVRAGYVGAFDGKRAGELGVKWLYGQAFREPPARTLYGGWTGSGSDSDLQPERSSTAEFAVTETGARLSQSVDLYWVRSKDRILVGTVPRNAGRGSVVGLDWAGRARLTVPRIGRVELWASYTHLFHASEDELEEDGSVTRYEYGDLSTDKLHLGATARPGDHLALDLRARWIGDRTTVPSNPIGTVDGFATADLTLSYRNVRDSGVGVSLAVTNVLDARYTEPGINDASAGDEPGDFVNGAYVGGSAGYFNSEMPQPGREVLLSLYLDR